MKTLARYLLVVVVILAGCAQTPAGDKVSTEEYVAKVDGSYITVSDVRRQFESLPEFMKAIYDNPEGVKKLTDELVKKELIYLEAKKEGLDKTPQYLEKLKEYQKLSLISMLLTKEIEEKVGLKEEEVRQYYDTHPEEFSTDRARASHILVETKEKAEELLRKIKAGEDFGALAARNSIDKGSASKGGDLGYFSRGQMVPEFEKVVFSMKKGDVRGPVKTQFGYHIIKLTDLKRGEPLKYDKVKERLSKRLLSEKQRTAFENYIERLRGSYKVELREEKLKDLKLAE